MPKFPPKNYIEAVNFPQEITLNPIGVVHSPYKERHGTPRQSQLQSIPKDYQPVLAQIELFPHIIPAIALKDMESFERIWIISWLHLNKHWNPTVILPRGPRVRRGTLATRAPHRPNPIGLSAPKLIKVEGLVLHVEGIDLLDQTPILDIKPYVSYCDAFPDARCGYVSEMEKAREHEVDVFGKGTLRE
ncbi:tRNA (N6-threonylcarbamoyladenosine(37)-N6)-methyltransferase TrmO [Calothrix sp. UHCC 0171]|uniref:tRNA (N6-threonylcarbamoyladenosine(37)-N6)-methyltransferase TrmO n=1 Tax=Calothrix sp. UHCC 0171 TaxID=3110245 RepID=UPI002B1F25AD|nr:tRNA (N6-threonylcarbamoyladenosine(37)-N6)-methyltransferase TrmO [Calothrix sp. UHCC 0171]MEA5573100.1 tRNA (N6-threonylcarbamoyladenosine(37)-N6)-methyltransferase TrmO [Calothrix sp. UHCC 0171]